jgi:Tol biopolymer transport system component
MTRNAAETGTDLLLFAVEDGTIRPVVVTENNEYRATFSPDGRWVAYTADDSGRDEIYVRPFAGGQGRWQISTEGASVAIWRKPDEIILQSGRKILSVRVRTSPVFSADPPQLLFESPNQLADLMPDGDRILVQTVAERGSSNAAIQLVTRWFSEVAERMRG